MTQNYRKFITLHISKFILINNCRGKSASSNTYGDRAPFWFGGGRRSGEERIETMHTRGLPSFGPHGCVKPYCCFLVCIMFLLGGAECYCTLRQLTRPRVSGLLPLRCAWGLLLYAQGVTHRWQHMQG